jgi:hypothetical protein
VQQAPCRHSPSTTLKTTAALATATIAVSCTRVHLPY